MICVDCMGRQAEIASKFAGDPVCRSCESLREEKFVGTGEAVPTVATGRTTWGALCALSLRRCGEEVKAKDGLLYQAIHSFGGRQADFAGEPVDEVDDDLFGGCWFGYAEPTDPRASFAWTSATSGAALVAKWAEGEWRLAYYGPRQDVAGGATAAILSGGSGSADRESQYFIDFVLAVEKPEIVIDDPARAVRIKVVLEDQLRYDENQERRDLLLGALGVLELS